MFRFPQLTIALCDDMLYDDSIVMIDPAFFFTHPVQTLFSLLGQTAIWWYPVISVAVMATVYMAYIRANYIKNLKWVLLEVKIPKDILKSPRAMEVVLTQMYQTGPASLIDIYIKGRVRSWFSLELISVGGEIHFYIRTEAKFKNMIETAIYSQYPGVEVYVEGEDYTHKVPYGLPGSDWDFFGAEFKLSEADAYPIRTYVDYGLANDPKEEFKIDPLSTVLEFLGSIGPNQQVWIQIPIMASRKKWKDIAAAEIKKIQEANKDKSQFGAMALLPGDRDKIEAIQRTLSKYGFECGFRAMYLARKDSFDGSNISRLLGSVKQYGSENMNGFGIQLATGFDYPWQDPFGRRLPMIKARMFSQYQHRSYFFSPSTSTPFVLNTEELATIYHFPGQVAQIPTLGRIVSKRGEPPANLPIG